MKKQYVLDTNVLLHDPQAILKFADNDVVISIAVIEEIDRFKKELNETGRNARLVSKYIDDLRSKGSLAKGVKLPDAGTLFVDIGVDGSGIFPIPKNTVADEIILACALRRQKANKDSPVVFITKDTNLRILADALGLQAVDYDSTRVALETRRKFRILMLK
jgi:PhoH-like ATPase